MYTKHFGLKQLPFENISDPKFFFSQGYHARIYQSLIESFNSGWGLTVVTGDIGAGKTMMSQMLIYNTSDDTKHIWMAEPPEKCINLFLFIALELGLKPASSDKIFVLKDIKDALIKIQSEGNKCLIILDESQTVADEVLDGIRLLNNLENDAEKLIRIYLFGQDEIMTIINDPANEPFKQRITTFETMGKMKTDQIRDYITHRLKIAGGRPSIFTETGWEALYSVFGNKGSIPRVINSLCNRSLILAAESGNESVDYFDVYMAAKQMGIYNETAHNEIEHKQSRKEYRFPDNWESILQRNSGRTDEEPVQLFSKDSDRSETGYRNGQTETSHLSQNGSKNNELAKKVRENYYSSIFRKTTVKKNEMPEKIKDSEIDIANASDGENEEPAKAKENNSSEIKINETKNENSFKPAKIRDNSLMIKEETASASASSSSEWVTINSEGEKPFDIEMFEKIKPTTMKEITNKLDEWETIRGKV